MASASRDLTELEGVALGIVRRQQPCTAYAVRRELKRAPSSHWRASAGSIYPLLERLAAESLLKGENDHGDGRGRRLLKVTRQGMRAVRRWIAKGSDMNVVTAVADPVRTRLFFLELLPASQRLTCAEQILVALERYLQLTNDHLATIDQEDDAFGYLGAYGAVCAAEARVSWMRVVLQTLRQ